MISKIKYLEKYFKNILDYEFNDCKIFYEHFVGHILIQFVNISLKYFVNIKLMTSNITYIKYVLNILKIIYNLNVI